MSRDLSQSLSEVVGADFVRPASPGETIGGVAAKLVVEPATPSEVARVLALANEAGAAIIPRGGGTKLDWGNPPRTAEVVLSLRRLDRVLEHAAGDMTATVEAGCTIAALQEALATRGQRLAVDSLWPEQATIGGVVATNDSGVLRTSFGTPRDLVLGVTVALADGTLARSGGKVVKNVAGYDLPKLFSGSFGTLGVVTQVTLRLHPQPEQARWLRFALPNDPTVVRFVAMARECSLFTTGVQIVALPQDRPTAELLVEGPSQVIASKVDRVAKAAQEAGATPLDSDRPIEASSLFSERESCRAVCKASVLPSQIGELLRIAAVGEECRSSVVCQIVGTALLRFESSDCETLRRRIESVRQSIGSLSGSLVVLACPHSIKSQIDAWGDCGDAVELMKSVKRQFDPKAILNPGRFVGGI